MSVERTRSTRVGVSAQGKGLVSSDGDVTLTETAQGQGWGFTATYRGRFDGTAAKLSGAQQWRLANNGGPYTRPCTITLSSAK